MKIQLLTELEGSINILKMLQLNFTNNLSFIDFNYLYITVFI